MVIVAGFGFRGATGLESLRDALAQAAPPGKICAIATASAKRDTAVFRALAKDLNVPAAGIAAAQLKAQQVQTCSDAALRAYGTGSVAEAAALAAAGPGARLLAPRVVSRDGRATCALAAGEAL